MFYREPGRFALPVEIWFLLDRYHHLLTFDFESKHVLSDFIFAKTRIFAQNNLSRDDFKKFDGIYSSFAEKVRKPDCIIYLKNSLQNVRDNISKRGRKPEKEISPVYLQQIQKAYEDYFKKNPGDMIEIDLSGVDFLNTPSDYEKIKSKIFEYLNQFNPINTK